MMLAPRLLLTLALAASSAGQALAQAADVPIYAEGRGARPNGAILVQAEKLAADKALPMTLEVVNARLAAPAAPCALDLPPPRTTRLEGRAVWQAARASHLRVGWRYLCTKCDRWHLSLAGGYVLTADGAVATCAHVVESPGMKQGALIAVTEKDEVLPVTEVLAVDRTLDTAILRVKGSGLTPLPLSLSSLPGDRVWCFSDPEGKRGYFSEGIVSRFVKRPFLSKKEEAGSGRAVTQTPPVWVETTTDWAPGSSGSAIVDEFGNAVGHVSEIQTMLEPPPEEPEASDDPTKARKRARAGQLGTTIVFHQGIAAQTVLRLVKKAETTR